VRRAAGAAVLPIACGWAAIACAGALVACGVVPAQAQTLALAYRSGDRYEYAIHSVVNEAVGASATTVPVKFDLTAHETVTVRSVDPSGTADLSITLSAVTMKSTTAGVTTTVTGAPLPSVEMKVAVDGRILSVNGSPVGGFAPLSGTGDSFISAVLPDTPVKPGDTWAKSYDQANPSGSGSIHVTANSKYLRDETLKGTKAAVVETSSSTVIDITIDMSKLTSGTALPIGGAGGIQGITIKGTSTSDVTTWIDPSGHRVVKSHAASRTTGTMSFVMRAGATMPMTGTMTTQGDAVVDLTPA
jgi:hypothetical protein